jgi:hypothetical protein
MHDGGDFDHDGCSPEAADRAAAHVLRRLASQIELAGYQARPLRMPSLTPCERARGLELALVQLTALMSEPEVAGLVNALRHAATATQEHCVCEFCGTQTQPWSLLTGDPGDDGLGPLTPHAWDQYGVTLCKNCHFVVRQARWQAAHQM